VVQPGIPSLALSYEGVRVFPIPWDRTVGPKATIAAANPSSDMRARTFPFVAQPPSKLANIGTNKGANAIAVVPRPMEPLLVGRLAVVRSDCHKGKAKSRRRRVHRQRCTELWADGKATTSAAKVLPAREAKWESDNGSGNRQDGIGSTDRNRFSWRPLVLSAARVNAQRPATLFEGRELSVHRRKSRTRKVFVVGPVVGDPDL